MKLQSYVIGAGKAGALAAVSATVNGQAVGDAHANGASAAVAKAMVKTADALSGAAGESENICNCQVLFTSENKKQCLNGLAYSVNLLQLGTETQVMETAAGQAAAVLDPGAFQSKQRGTLKRPARHQMQQTTHLRCTIT